MKPVHKVLFAAGLLILGAITWLVLTVPKPQATWLQVEAPARAAPGEAITLRVTLTNPDPNLLLTVDLHGWTKRKQPLRVVSRTSPRHVGPSATALDFSLRVPRLPDLASVRGIIYLTPTGQWPDRIIAATTDEIAIHADSDQASARELQPLPAHDQTPDPVIPRIESPGLRGLLVGLWLVVAVGLGLRLRRTRAGSTDTSNPPISSWSGLLIGACLAAGLAELLRGEQLIGDTARHFAQQHGYYDERLLPQQIAVLLTVVAVAALAVIIVARARHRRVVLGLLVYAAISLTAALSLHEADALLYTMILGLPIEQLAKLGAVSLSLWGLRSQRETSSVA